MAWLSIAAIVFGLLCLVTAGLDFAAGDGWSPSGVILGLLLIGGGWVTYRG